MNNKQKNRGFILRLSEKLFGIDLKFVDMEQEIFISCL